ncbi:MULTISPECIES: GtrA family protein [unclassified Streptococcus]|uniref:GtrA family protein n=1 Tax=unclassified Streptococcus TaxID=2608887 RepID=UPI0010726CBC|nr:MULTISPECIES: GtrA family protein [unclassified Streptococcus]MBF0788229.1 GtrA family protein [Streptococcus sp. 19428wC2_LYSM12]MCQ9212182.1 GtrA family protein [Streptococcus sp. B01]MCQ9213512.1 GtrA family protein [Streptococcus sp. O1]TFV04698.1 GtrA family protein [Streptococcus sp. LYSM12]
MKKYIQAFFNNEILAYLFFGVASTLVYIITRTSLFFVIPHTLTVVFISNCLAILFAFITNDQVVFKQQWAGWQTRLFKFISARITTLLLDMVLAYILVDAFPQLLGQFVNQNPSSINAMATLISQVLVIVLNYILSKTFVFQNTKKNS